MIPLEQLGASDGSEFSGFPELHFVYFVVSDGGSRKRDRERRKCQLALKQPPGMSRSFRLPWNQRKEARASQEASPLEARLMPGASRARSTALKPQNQPVNFCPGFVLLLQASQPACSDNLLIYFSFPFSFLPLSLLPLPSFAPFCKSPGCLKSSYKFQLWDLAIANRSGMQRTHPKSRCFTFFQHCLSLVRIGGVVG